MPDRILGPEALARPGLAHDGHERPLVDVASPLTRFEYSP
jgi:hypothetical protein